MLQKEEDVHDGKILKRLIKKKNKNRDPISKVIADGSYDSNENSQFLSSNGILI